MTHAIVRVDIATRQMRIEESGFEDGVAARRAVSRIKATPQPGAIFIYGELVDVDTTTDDADATLASIASAGGILLTVEGTTFKVLILGNVESFLKYLKLLLPRVRAGRQKRETRAERKDRVSDSSQRYGSAAPLGSGKLPRKMKP